VPTGLEQGAGIDNISVTSCSIADDDNPSLARLESDHRPGHRVHCAALVPRQYSQLHWRDW
jgi:hypothetical protein